MDEDDFKRLRAIGFTPALAQAFVATAADDAAVHVLIAARVIEVQRETLTVHDGKAPLTARLHPQLARDLLHSGDAPAVGDWVAVAADAYGDLWLRALLPPTTRLVRTSDDGRRQTLVSNVDLALLVMGLDGDFNPRRIERYLALVQGAGVMPAIVLTKADCAPAPADRVAVLRERIPAAVPIESVNALDPATAGQLAPLLAAGTTAVLLGSSGAGKSTLTNTLLGAAVQTTGEVRAADARGRHTTTSRTLHRLPGGACLIDTPGLRGLRVDLDEEQLVASYADIAALAGACRFRDCRHQDEPGCAVRAAIDADRLKNFHKLQREARRESLTPLQRQTQRNEWKARGRAAEQRMRLKRS